MRKFNFIVGILIILALIGRGGRGGGGVVLSVIGGMFALAIGIVAFLVGGWHGLASCGICLGSLLGLILILRAVFHRR